MISNADYEDRPERVAGELQCDCDLESPITVLLYEDGDWQDDGSVLWSGCATGECDGCGQVYADWWEGTFKIGSPTASPTASSEAR